MDTEEIKTRAILEEGKMKVRDDMLKFLDEKMPGENQLEKDIYLYSIIENAALSQMTVLEKVYGIKVERLA